MSETYYRTIKIPLQELSDRKAGRINHAMKEYLRVRQELGKWYSDRVASDVNISERSQISKEIRKDHSIELPATTVRRAVDVVHQNYCEYEDRSDAAEPNPEKADAYALDSKATRIFYDDGYYLNIDTGIGRVLVPLRVSDESYHSDYLPFPEDVPYMLSKRHRTPGTPFWEVESELLPEGVSKLSSSTLHKTNSRKYQLHLVHQREREGKLTGEEARYVIGVDRGRNQLAYAALYDRENDHVAAWWNRKGKEVQHYMDRFSERISEFQKAKAWDDMEAAKGKRRRYKKQLDYEVANSIVDLSDGIEGDIVVAIEELAGLSKLGNYSIENRRFNEWSYYRQEDAIRDKCEESGIGVIEIDPYYTSQDCSRCGSGDTDRKSIYFNCNDCGYQQHSDANAAVNIAKRAVDG